MASDIYIEAVGRDFFIVRGLPGFEQMHLPLTVAFTGRRRTLRRPPLHRMLAWSRLRKQELAKCSPLYFAMRQRIKQADSRFLRQYMSMNAFHDKYLAYEFAAMRFEDFHPVMMGKQCIVQTQPGGWMDRIIDQARRTVRLAVFLRQER